MGLADVRPANHMVLLLIIIAGPIESRLDFGDLMVKGLVEAVEAHEEQEEAGEGGVDENRSSRLRQPPTLPWLNASLQLGHSRTQVSDCKPRVTNGRAQVGCGEGA